MRGKLKINKPIYLSTPHLSGQEWEYVKDALDSNWITSAGPHLEALEREVAAFCGAEYAVAMVSGTAALHISLELLGIGPGDTVFCSSLTFVGSANPILYQGARPVFIDSDRKTWNISPRVLQKALKTANDKNKLPKAVIAVDLFGLSCEYDEIKKMCAEFGVPLVEDAAESLGSRYRDRPCGNLGDLGIVSFNGNKIITTSGGGMLLTDDVQKAKRARFLINQAKDNRPWYEHSTLGYNYRMSNILAALGRAQMKVLTERVEQRRRTFHFYLEKLGGEKGLIFMPRPSGYDSNCWLTALYLEENASRKSTKELIAYLNERHIEARHIWKPMHLQPLFKDCEFFAEEDVVFSEFLFDRGICLPSGSNLSEEQLRQVVAALLSAL